MVFVANATAGIKLVAEALANARDHNGRQGFWFGYHRDAHTSLVGARELAEQGNRCFGGDSEVETWIDVMEEGNGKTSLFAYPAQSNMNGRRLPSDWCGRLRRANKQGRTAYSLLDAAAFVSTSPLDLSDVANAPDFTVLSFYKMFGFPDLGALIVRKEAAHIFRRRRYFGGGTVEVVACMGEQWHFRKDDPLHEALEDGTLPIHSIIALDSAITVHERLFGNFQHISAHTTFLTRLLYQKMKDTRHGNGRSIYEIYEDSALYPQRWDRGPVIAFNFRDSRGQWVSNHEVQKLAIVKNIHLRTGNLCNPGGISDALQIAPEALKDNYVAGLRCGNERDVLGGKPTGVIRVSLGAMSTLSDVHNFLNFVDEFFVDKNPMPTTMPLSPFGSYKCTIGSLTVYPIKSCGGWRVPVYIPWGIRSEGLTWDREWCLIHQGTRCALSQKKYPRMALFKPSFDFSAAQLRVRWTGAQDAVGVPPELSIPLALDPAFFCNSIALPNDTDCQTNVCGDMIQPLTYASNTITTFFSAHLQVPVYLARFPSSTNPSSSQHTRFVKAKAPLSFQSQYPVKSPSPITSIPGAFPTPPPSPPPPRRLLLANESPLLIIFLSSLDALNTAIRANGGEEVSADAFRANIVLDDLYAPHSHLLPQPPLSELPLSLPGTPASPEDFLSHLVISRSPSSSDLSLFASRPLSSNVSLSLLAPCRRCQMVCIDQDTGERRQEPFSTLAKTRRWGGGVWFGVHAALNERERESQRLGTEGNRLESGGEKGEAQARDAEAMVRVGDLVEGR